MRNSQLVETYWYNAARNRVVEVTLRDGKVTSVTTQADLLPPPD